MTRHINRSLAFPIWPASDRAAWETCFDSVDLFDDAHGVHLSAATKYGRQAAYGKWLGFIDLFDPAALDLAADQRVTTERIQDYVEYLRENCRDTTVADDLSRLYYVMRMLSPDRNFDWLYRLSRRLARQAVPLQHPPVISADLYALGLRLMDKAKAKVVRAARMTRSAAITYRDGLLIATLVEAPLRRRAFSQLRISEHLHRIGDQWLIMTPPELTKTREPAEYLLSKRVSKEMDLYLDRYRLAFPGAAEHDFLWTYLGRPMTDKMIRRRTIRWTRGWAGGPVSPHRFRRAAANFILEADPENIRMAKDLLGHASFAMTEKHYIDQAQTRLAGRALHTILAQVLETQNA